MVVSLLNEKGLLLGHVVFCHISPSGNNKPYYEGGSRTSGLKFEHNQIKSVAGGRSFVELTNDVRSIYIIHLHKSNTTGAVIYG